MNARPAHVQKNSAMAVQGQALKKTHDFGASVVMRDGGVPSTVV